MVNSKSTAKPSGGPIGLFRQHVTSRDRLAATTVGRQELLDDLMEKLTGLTGKKGRQHFLFIGPRGIGKTHFLSLVEEGVRCNKKLKNSYVVIRFPEENNRILSFADFLLGIVDILADETGDKRWDELYAQYCENDDDRVIVDAVIPLLNEFHRKNGKMLLIFIENLDVLLSQQIKNEQHIHQFRTFLMDSLCAVLIGASPTYFPGLYSVKSPLYDFFDIQVLDEFDEELTLEVIRRNLQWDGRDDLLATFDDLKPKILTLHTMTGGNPRLILMLYELIAKDNLSEVKAEFQKLLDLISPFYQDRLKDLAPHERALLENLALMRTEPRTPANIAKKMRKPPQQISTLLKRMTDAGYLSAADNPQDRRSRIYRIKEGFFDLWLSMSESRRQRKYVGYLVDFFSQYYAERQERERKKEAIWRLLKEPDKEEKTEKNAIELLSYLSEVGDADEQIQSKLEIAHHLNRAGDHTNVREMLREIGERRPQREIYTWISERMSYWPSAADGHDVEKWFDDLINYWRYQRTGDLEKAVALAFELGAGFSGLGQHRICIEILTESLQNATDDERKMELLARLAESHIMIGRIDQARELLNKKLLLAKERRNKPEIALALLEQARIEKLQGNIEQALSILEEAAQLLQGDESNREHSIVKGEIARIYVSKGEVEKALKLHEEELEVYESLGDKRSRAVTLGDIARIYVSKGEVEKALKLHEERLQVFESLGDKRSRAVTLGDIARIYVDKGEVEKALKLHEERLQVNNRLGDMDGIAAALFDLAQINLRREEYQEAFDRLENSYDIFLKLGRLDGICFAGLDLGQLFCRAKQTEQGLAILSRSEEGFRRLGRDDYAAHVREIIAEFEEDRPSSRNTFGKKKQRVK